MFDRRRREDTVAEVENVTGTAAGACKHLVSCGEDAIERAEEQRRIEVALDGALRSMRSTRRRAACQSAPTTSPPASRMSPRVDPVPTPKVDRRHALAVALRPAHAGDRSFLRVREDELAIISGIQRPTHESNTMTASTPASIWATRYSPMTSARVSQKRCHAAGVPTSATSCAKFVECPPSIACEASVNGRTGKADQWHAGSERALDLTDGVEDVAQFLRELERVDAREVGFARAASRSPDLRRG